jgi:hypothetical protein
MSTYRYHFYHKATGLFHSKMVSTDQATGAEGFAAANAPEGHTYIAGVFDPLSQRVDLTGEKPVVVDYQPLQPSPDHEWHTTTKRWHLKPEVQTKQAAHDNAMAQIQALELGQHRAVRECALGNTLGVKRLLEIEARIKELRGQL